MEKNRIIVNRFMPNETSPIFFAGRHKQLTDILLALTDFATNNGLRQHLHLLTGKSGVGKTTFLKHLYKQVVGSPEMVNYIPVYICAKHCSSLTSFYLAILNSLQQSFRDNAFRSGIIEQCIRTKESLDELSLIAPLLSEKLRKSLTTHTLVDFFHCLEDINSNQALLELIKLLNYACTKNNTFLFFIFDHTLPLLEKDEVSTIFINCCREMEKHGSRYFSIFSVDEKKLQDIRNVENQDQGGISLLLQNINLFVAENETQISSQVSSIIKSLKSGEKFAVFGISKGCDIKNAMGALNTRTIAEFQSITLQCFSENFESFLSSACEAIVEKFESIQSPFKPKLPQTAQMLKSEIQKKKNYKEIVDYFGLLLSRLDKGLSQEMVIIFQGFQECMQQKRTFSSSARMSVSLLKKQMEYKYLLPSPTFIKFFHILLNLSNNCKKISIVPVLEMPSYEFPVYNKNSLFLSLTNGNHWYLREFLYNDTALFIKETAAKSGVLFDDFIIDDLHNQSGGLPIHLQVLCRYIVQQLEDGLSPSEQQVLQSNLLTKNNLSTTYLKTGSLASNEDGRVRFSINKSFHNNIKKTCDEVYKELFSEIQKTVSNNILKIICENEVIFVDDLSEVEGALEGIAHLEYHKLLTRKEKYVFFNEVIKKNFLLILSESSTSNIRKTSRITNVSEKKSLENQAVYSIKSPQVLQSLKSKHLIRATEKKTKPDTFLKLNHDTRIFKLDKENTTDKIFELMTSALEEEILPSSLFIKKIEEHIELNEDSASFQYLKTLALYICNKMSLDSKLLLHNFHMELNKGKEKKNILEAIENVFFQESSISKFSNEKAFDTLFHFHLLRYKLLGTHVDLPQALEALCLWLPQNISDPKALQYILVAKTYIHHIQDNSILNNLGIVLQEFMILAEAFKKGTFYVIKEMKEISNQNVNAQFQSFLVSCCLSLITKDINEYITSYSLQIVSENMYAMNNSEEIKSIVRLLPTHKSKIVRKAFYNFLMQGLPFIDSSYHQEIFAMLLEALQQEEMYPKIIQVIQGYILLVPIEEAFFLLKDSANSHFPAIQFNSWLTLMNLWPLLPPKEKALLEKEAILYYLNNISTFSQDTIHSIIYEFVITIYESKREILLDFIHKKIQEKNLRNKDAEGFLFVISNLELQAQEKVAINDRIIALLNSGNINNQKTAMILGRNRHSEEVQALLLEFSSETKDIQSEAQIYFFNTLSANEKISVYQEIHNRLLTYKNKKFFIDAACKLLPFFNNEQIKEIDSVFLQIVKNNLYNVDAQCVLRYSGNIALALNNKNCELQQFISGELLEKPYPHIWEHILCSFNGFSPEISGRDIEPLVYKLLDNYSGYSHQFQMNICDFLNYVLSNLVLDKICETYIKDFLIKNISNYKYAPAAIPIFIKHFDLSENIMRWLYAYQFNCYTCYIPFALYEIVPDTIVTIPHLLENYENINTLDNYYLHYNMISFYYRLGSLQATEEVLNSVSQNAIIPASYWQMLKLKQYWSVKLSLRKEYIDSSLQLQNLGF